CFFLNTPGAPPAPPAPDRPGLPPGAAHDPDVLLNRGIAHQADGRPDLARADFDRALALPGADLAELAVHRARCTG
ncbi:hypothetical protein ACFV6F_37795, partial [Kitasatospora phosalacinea]